jgi:hypothetical protein
MDRDCKLQTYRTPEDIMTLKVDSSLYVQVPCITHPHIYIYKVDNAMNKFEFVFLMRLILYLLFPDQ